MAFGEVGTSLSKIKANSLNLAGTYGFSGTVSGLADETPLVLISTFTSDGSDATASFTSGIDSTYKEYLFIFNNIHASASGADALFQFQGSSNTGSAYGVAITSTAFFAYHDEADSTTSLSYDTNDDLAQGTGFQNLSNRSHNDNDSSMSGILKLYNPSSTTFVKHFMAVTNNMHNSPMSLNERVAGYFNTTSVIDAIQFKFNTGEIQGGTIDLFGVV